MATLTVTNTNDTGAGSLRAQIAAAASGDTIVFATALSGGTITLTSGQLNVDKSLTITGLGADKITIDGNNASRVFNVQNGLNGAPETVVITGLTITKGREATNGERGGGIRVVGENLTLDKVAITANEGSWGGGLAFDGTGGASLTVTNSTVSGNNGPVIGGGVLLENSTSAAFQHVTFASNNTGGQGGGIANPGSSSGVSIRNSSFIGNFAAAIGSDVWNPGTVAAFHNSITSASGGWFGNAPTSESYNYWATAPSFRISGTNVVGATVDVTTATVGGLLVYRPNAGSALINAGDPAYTTPTVDELGLLRIHGGRVDIGAVEATVAPIGGIGGKGGNADSIYVGGNGGLGEGVAGSAGRDNGGGPPGTGGGGGGAQAAGGLGGHGTGAAGGGAGGAAGAAGGGLGGTGTTATSGGTGAGGGGGGGGGHNLLFGVGTNVASGASIGGAGGAGGAGDVAFDRSGGGGGGAGGYGNYGAAAGTNTVSGGSLVRGGAGGAGGNGGTTGTAQAGGGGAGGVGWYAGGTGNTLVNLGTIQGGAGGAAGTGVVAGANGVGGVGIDFGGGTLTNSGTITGGAAGGAGALAGYGVVFRANSTFNIASGGVLGTINGGVFIDGAATASISLNGRATGSISNVDGAGNVIFIGGGEFSVSNNRFTGGAIVDGATKIIMTDALGIGAAGGSVTFGPGSQTLALNYGFANGTTFGRTLTDLSTGDVIDVTGVGLATSHTLIGNTLALFNGATNVINFTLADNHGRSASHFALSSDGAGGTNITVVLAGGGGGAPSTGGGSGAPSTPAPPPTAGPAVTATSYNVLGTPGTGVNAPPATVTTPDGRVLPNPILEQQKAIAALIARVDAGTLTLKAAQDIIVDMADATTSVGTMSYQFFTGKLPTKAGIDYLVSSSTNPNDLNDGYYAGMAIENRYINFAVNLGKFGEGSVKFASDYGSLSVVDAAAKAYAVVFGTVPTAAKMAEILTTGRLNYLSILAGDPIGSPGIGTKAAIVGFFLGEAAKADIGPMAARNENFLYDLLDGTAAFGADAGIYQGAGPTTIALVGVAEG